MTPFEEAGYTKDDYFEVLVEGCFKKGSITRLYGEAESAAPLFELVEGACNYNHCDGKPGAYLLINGIKKIDYKPSEKPSETISDSTNTNTPVEGENVSESSTDSLTARDLACFEQTTSVTGGSSPNYYRKQMTLPLSSDRSQFVEVDVEAGDVAETFGLCWNAANVFKSMVRGDNKEGVDEKYALDKELWFVLRRRMTKGLITHKQFWEYAEILGLSKEK